MTVIEQVKKVQETAVTTAKDVGGQVTVQAKDISGQVATQARDIGGQVTVQAKDISGQVATQAKDIGGQVPAALRQLDLGTAVSQLRDQAKGVDVKDILDEVQDKVKSYEQPVSDYLNTSATRTRGGVENLGSLVTSLVDRVKEQLKGLASRQTEVVVEVAETVDEVAETDVAESVTPDEDTAPSA